MREKISNILFYKDGALLGTILGLTVVALGVVFLEPRIQEWASEQDSIVNSTAVGVAINSEYEQSLLTSRSSVETTNGIFTVKGAFQLVKGNELVINEIKSGSRYLCDVTIDACNKLL